MGDKFINPLATYQDDVDGNLNFWIIIVGTVNFKVVELYTLTYNFSDATGNNAAEKIRKVEVNN